MALIKKPLSPLENLARMLLSLPPEVGAQIFKELSPEEVQAVTQEISGLPALSAEQRSEAFREFAQQEPDFWRWIQALPEQGPQASREDPGEREAWLELMSDLLQHILPDLTPEQAGRVLERVRAKPPGTLLGRLDPRAAEQLLEYLEERLERLAQRARLDRATVPNSFDEFLSGSA